MIKIIIYIHFDKLFSYINIMELPKFFEFLMKKRDTIPLYFSIEPVLPEGIADDEDSPELTNYLKLNYENNMITEIEIINNKV